MGRHGGRSRFFGPPPLFFPCFYVSRGRVGRGCWAFSMFWREMLEMWRQTALFGLILARFRDVTRRVWVRSSRRKLATSFQTRCASFPLLYSPVTQITFKRRKARRCAGARFSSRKSNAVFEGFSSLCAPAPRPRRRPRCGRCAAAKRPSPGDAGWVKRASAFAESSYFSGNS